MSEKIVVSIKAKVPDTTGQPRHVVGFFVMQGDWQPVSLDHPPVVDTHPCEITSVCVAGPDGWRTTPTPK